MHLQPDHVAIPILVGLLFIVGVIVASKRGLNRNGMLLLVGAFVFALAECALIALAVVDHRWATASHQAALRGAASKGRSAGALYFVPAEESDETGKAPQADDETPTSATEPTKPAPFPKQATTENAFAKGMAAHREKDFDSAVAAFSEVLRLDPNHSSAWYNRALARQRKGDAKGALADYSKAIAIAPDRPEAYFNRGLVQYELGAHEAALADFSEAIRRDPKDAAAFHARAVVHRELGRSEKARLDVEAARRLDPDYRGQ